MQARQFACTEYPAPGSSAQWCDESFGFVKAQCAACQSRAADDFVY